MAGAVLPVIPKRFLDFATLPLNTSEDVVVADRVNLVHWRELHLRAEFHSTTLPTGSSIQIIVFAQSWTPEEPGLEFLDTISAGSVTLTAGAAGNLRSGSILT